jgi:hypothetical protein
VSTTETTAPLRCTGCGDTFVLSPRRAREWRDREPLCRDCRRKPKELSEAERARLQRWWLDRYSLEELVEIGREIWPDLAGRTTKGSGTL